MPRPLPKYIPVNLISIDPLSYKWNDWDPYEPIAWPDEHTKALLLQCSNRAIIGFALGCAEWVVGRLSRYFESSEALEYLDAFWYYILGGNDSVPPPTNDELWEGEVLGPVNLSLMTILNSVYASEDGPPVQSGSFAAQIALHVLNRPDLFLDWQSVVLNRLTHYCKCVSDKQNGEPFPRALFDPLVDVDRLDVGVAIRQELLEIEAAVNRYL
jgi:hypothetical protein